MATLFAMKFGWNHMKSGRSSLLNFGPHYNEKVANIRKKETKKKKKKKMLNKKFWYNQKPFSTGQISP